MRNHFLWFCSLLGMVLLAACAPVAGQTAQTPESVTLHVFAAASLTEAFTEIGTAFEEQQPGVSVVFNFAGSQALAQQINEGAPADVFASANNAQMNAAVEGGRIAADTPQTFVTNRLVVIYPVDNPAGLTVLHDLSKPGLRLVLAAAEVPVGQYSIQFLDKTIEDTAFGASFKDQVLANVVSFEDNVKVVLTKVALGEADAGIVYSSDVVGDNASQVGQMDIPDALNVLASYPIAPVSDSANANTAAEFISYVRSLEGQKILRDYGLIPVIDIE